MISKELIEENKKKLLAEQKRIKQFWTTKISKMAKRISRDYETEV
jgi:hypothetical protein